MEKEISPGDNIYVCGTCSREVEDEDPSIECDGPCKKWHHKDCAGITSGEFDIMTRKTCSLSWFCDVCKYELLKRGTEAEEMEKMAKKIDHIMEFLATKLGSVIEDKINIALQHDRPTVIKEKRQTKSK